MQHTCVKCKSPYIDEAEDDYYCEPCNEVRKKVAAEVDKKFRPSEREPSELQTFEDMGKTQEQIGNAGGIQINIKRTFVRAGDFLK